VASIPYGPLPDNFGVLRVPQGAGPFPVVVIIHGGYWREAYGLDIMDPAAEDLTARGYATWNIEYRRLGLGGGGYPATFQDIADAVDHLALIASDWTLDLSRVAFLGHSAGGHLAAWAAGRQHLPVDAPGASPIVRPAAAVLIAAVLDIESAFHDRLGGSAVAELLGSASTPAPAVLAVTSPVRLLPAGAALVVLHGDADYFVPVSQSERYHKAALAAGDSSQLIIESHVDHFEVIDPRSGAWADAVAALVAVMPPAP
jgi:acetyl esterase/lipase